MISPLPFPLPVSSRYAMHPPALHLARYDAPLGWRHVLLAHGSQQAAPLLSNGYLLYFTDSQGEGTASLDMANERVQSTRGPADAL